jgi:ATP-dependent Clp protease protease subunit
MTEKEILSALLIKNIIVIEGEICLKTFEYVAASVAILTGRNNPEITVNIASNGGDVDAGLDIYDLLSTYPNKVTGVVFAGARSMATIILQACSTRLVCRHSGILIHHIARKRVTLDALRSKGKLGRVVKQMEEQQKRLYDILSGRTGQTVKRIRQVCLRDQDMTAEEAVEFGLADAIMPVRQDLVIAQNS